MKGSINDMAAEMEDIDRQQEQEWLLTYEREIIRLQKKLALAERHRDLAEETLTRVETERLVLVEQLREWKDYHEELTREVREQCNEALRERDEVKALIRKEQNSGDQDWFKMKQERDEARALIGELMVGVVLGRAMEKAELAALQARVVELEEELLDHVGLSGHPVNTERENK